MYAPKLSGRFPQGILYNRKNRKEKKQNGSHEVKENGKLYT